MIRTLLALSALSTFPLTAAAGPIPWTFQSEFGGELGGSSLLLTAYPDIGWYGGTAHTWAGSGWENSAYSVGVGYLYFGQIKQNQWPPPNGYEDTYRAAFTVTDTGSGESATVTMAGSSIYSVFGQQQVTKEFVLGGHEYEITLKERREPEAISVIASVGVTTPEPGTLSLALLGLLPLTGQILRWKMI